MVNGKPLFPGSSVEDQLKLIFVLLGTPPKRCWPNLTIPYKFAEVECGRVPLKLEVPRLDSTAINLLEEFMQVSSLRPPIRFLRSVCVDFEGNNRSFCVRSITLKIGFQRSTRCGTRTSTISERTLATYPMVSKIYVYTYESVDSVDNEF